MQLDPLSPLEKKYIYGKNATYLFGKGTFINKAINEYYDKNTKIKNLLAYP